MAYYFYCFMESADRILNSYAGTVMQKWNTSIMKNIVSKVLIVTITILIFNIFSKYWEYNLLNDYATYSLFTIWYIGMFFQYFVLNDRKVIWHILGVSIVLTGNLY